MRDSGIGQGDFKIGNGDGGRMFLPSMRDAPCQARMSSSLDKLVELVCSGRK